MRSAEYQRTRGGPGGTGPARRAGSLGRCDPPHPAGWGVPARPHPGSCVSLRSLPPLLREEPALTGVLGTTSAVLAVPEPARAITVAALTTLSSRRPVVVAVPTTG